MRWCLCVCLLALLSLDEVTSASRRNKNSHSLEPDEDHEPVRNTMDINNSDDEFGEGSGSISIEGSGTPPPVIGSGEQEILLLNLRVTEVNGRVAKFTEDLLNNETPVFKQMERTVCYGVLIIVSNEDDIDCRVIEFIEGSIIAKTELTIAPSSVITPEEIETQITKAANEGSVGELTVDPESIVVKSPYTTVKMTSTGAPTRKMVTTSVGSVDETKPTMKVKSSTTNEFIFEVDGTREPTTQMIDVSPAEEKSFFDRLFESPVLLAGMVGAAVLVLLTMILLSMFIVYRVKKKDEGSYSLDEPGKMKDPQAYWKDTKEFYA